MVIFLVPTGEEWEIAQQTVEIVKSVKGMDR